MDASGWRAIFTQHSRRAGPPGRRLEQGAPMPIWRGGAFEARFRRIFGMRGRCRPGARGRSRQGHTGEASPGRGPCQSGRGGVQLTAEGNRALRQRCDPRNSHRPRRNLSTSSQTPRPRRELEPLDV
ncbi:hypothetical protein BV20DRAFT_383808 [Pilatotrama ljubarskyi]|nr:hypothetical protein BV20DRAFT_383808 [Pilatotrama ljubarskyi]